MWPRCSRPPASAVLRIRGNNVGDPWGNRFDVVAYSEVQFMKADPVLLAQNATHLIKSDSALAELREKGIDV